MIKAARTLLAALTLALVTGCAADITGPTAQDFEGKENPWMGSGGTG